MSRFEKWFLLSMSFLTTATGVVYLAMKYSMEPVDPWAVINHPLQPAVLKAHILVAPLLVFALGLVTTRHIWRHYRSGTRKARRSGLSTALSAVPMIVTGYLIQAITGEGLLLAMAYAHIAFGIGFAGAISIHTIIFYRRQRGGRDRTGTGRKSPARATLRLKGSAGLAAETASSSSQAGRQPPA